MTDWATGVQLGPYTLVSPLGAGGMGEVWKARDTRLNRIVAIKRLAAPYSDRFDQEARAIAALNHPHICQIHDVGQGYLILEYIEGRRLQGPLPTDQALRLAIQIAGALEHAHGCGILHRDLKPANVIVTLGGEAKLLDFGLAKLVNGDVDLTRTLEGAVVGTAAYMSPEQAEGRTLDSRSDIFSFGAMLYEMLSGVRAFGGTTTLHVLNAVLRDTPPPLQAASGLERIVRQCLAKLPASRFQTMGEVRAALELASRELVSPATSTQPSIAVLPFADMSPGKDHEWFSDGVAEEIINALTHVPGLVVIARTSAFAFKGKNEDIRRIAETLGVAHVLEGSVRRAGSRVRVTAQLITAANGSHLWSERFDREIADVFAVQDEIASAIAATLQVKLAGTPATHRRYTPTLPAYEAFLKALHYAQKLTPDAMTRSREHFEQAIALDPGFALAHSMYGFYFAQLANYGLLPAHEAMPLVRDKARRALEIDPSLPDPSAMLGIVAGLYDYDWKEAEHQFRLAMAADPIPAQVRRAYALYYLLPTGRFREAADECERALKEDPLDLMGRLRMAQCFRAAGRLEDSFRTLQEVLELDENLWFTHFVLGVEHMLFGNASQGMIHAERAYILAPWSHSAIGGFAAALTRSGETKRAEELLEKLKPGDAYGAPIGLGTFHFLCSEFEQSVDWVRKAIEQRHPAVFFFLNVHGQALRSSPSWPELADSLNLRDRLVS
jgi:TolB-like protein/predicted Ser/Thr protein kinase